MLVTVRYFAGARAAAGCAEDVLEAASGAVVQDVIGRIAARHGAKLAGVLPACSLLLDEVAVRDRSVPVADGSVLDVLPPFAGG